jgi:cyanate permease
VAGLPDSSSADAIPPVPYRWVVLAGLWLVYVTFGLMVVSLAPLVVPITRDLGISHGTLGFVFGAWQLMFVLAAVPCGMLLDRIGARRGLLIGIGFVVVSGILRSVSTDAVMLWIAVAVFGIGGPLVSTGAPKLVSRWFSGPERGFAMGIYISGPSIGSIIGLSVTNSVLMPSLDGDWRAILLIWACLAGLAGLVWLAISQAPEMRKSDIAAESGPRLPQGQALRELLSIPAVRLLLLMAVGGFMFNHSLNNWLPELLRSRGMSAAMAGYWATIPTVIGVVCSLILPRLATPRRRYLFLIGICASTALASLLLRADEGPVLLLGLILQGTARSTLSTLMILTLVETPGIGERRAGMASGLFFSCAEVGGATGPVLLGIVHDLSGGFSAGLACLTGIAVCLVVAAVILRREARSLHQPANP